MNWLTFAFVPGSHQKKIGDNIYDFYRTTSNYKLNEGFFARFLIIVEGETEELTLPVYLKQVGIDCDLLGVSVIAVNGKNQIPKYWRLFYKFEIPMLVMFDNDNSNGKEKSNENLAKCFNCSINDFLDNYIYKVIDVSGGSSGSTFKQKLMVLEKDFETAIRKNWIGQKKLEIVLNKFEEEAKEFINPIGNQNKGQISRYLAEKLVKEFSFIPDFVEEIKKII